MVYVSYCNEKIELPFNQNFLNFNIGEQLVIRKGDRTIEGTVVSVKHDMCIDAGNYKNDLIVEIKYQ